MKKVFLSLLMLVAFIQLNAQMFNPVKWDQTSKHVAGDQFDLIFTAIIEDGWSVYGQDIAEDGPVPTSFYFDEGDHFSKDGAVKESGNRKKKFDKVFEMEIVKFSKKGIFTQRVTASDYTKPITGYFEFMTCNDERCLPPTEVDFEFKLEKPAAATTEAPKEEKKEQKQDDSATENQPETTADAAVPAIEEEAPSAEVESNKKGFIQPVTWDAQVTKGDNNQHTITLTADVAMEGWALYSKDTPEGGPIPTEMGFDDEAVKVIGDIKEEGEMKKGFDKTFGVDVFKFPHGPVKYTINVDAGDKETFTGWLSYMACDDSKCIAFDEEFTVDTKNGKVLMGVGANTTPATTNTNTDSNSTFGVDESGLHNSLVSSLKNTYKNPVGDCGEEVESGDDSLLWTFILGFGGGLLALLTPCVFPMIPLTVSFFTKSSKDRASGIRNALLYGLSIIVIYVAIGLLITGVFGAEALQDLSTSWVANTLFFVIFIFFAFSFFGYYEITLPSSWTTKTDAISQNSGLVGIFFMAFTLALVSFSCTGPIIGSALVESATNKLGPAVVMLGFSSALALPFALFAAFPGWLNSLPRSGGWMNSVKVILGFLELALALKFLSVADMTSHWGILPYEVFMGLWVIVFIGMALYLFGFISFPHDSKNRKISTTQKVIGGLSILSVFYLLSGFTFNEKTKAYNSLSALSGLAPPAHYNLFLPEPEVDPEIKKRFPSYTKCANNLDCFKNYEEGVTYAKEVKKPILLDFTGYGCVNCRKTEEHIWVKDKVWTSIAEDYVLISLYTDDRNKLDTPVTSKYRDGKKLRTVGALWQDFQIVNFDQNSQPLYVLLDPLADKGTTVMAPPRGYQESVSDYEDFLECGVTTFEKRNK